MLGFIYAEELKDYAKAQDAFNKLIKDYPNSPLIKDAQFMLGLLGAAEPPASADTAGVP